MHFESTKCVKMCLGPGLRPRSDCDACSTFTGPSTRFLEVGRLREGEGKKKEGKRSEKVKKEKEKEGFSIYVLQ